MRYLTTLLALALCSCAQTVLYSPNSGKRLAIFQGDMTGSHYAGGGVMWDVQSVSHSAATLAGGQAFKMGADSAGTTIVSSLLTGGLPWQAGIAAGASVLPQVLAPTVPAVLQSKH